MPRNLATLRAALLVSALSTPWAIMREAGAAIVAQLEGGQLRADGGAATGIGAGEEWETRAPEAKMTPGAERAIARREGAVVVIPVSGLIAPRATFMDYLMGYNVCPPWAIVNAVEDAVADPAVKAVVITWDSPGGVTTGVPEAFARLYALRGVKPIVSQIVGACGSAAYWLACAPEDISMTESGMAGSVGSYLPHTDLSGSYAQEGVVKTYVEAPVNGFKTEGKDSEPLSDEARAHMQEVVDDGYAMFVRDVARGRGVAESVVRSETFGKGRAYTAPRCVQRGMVDRVRGLTETLMALGVTSEPTGPVSAGRTRSLSFATQQARVAGIDV